jgi:hypothetical protein
MLLSKNTKIEPEYDMYISRLLQKSVSLPAVVYECESWFLKFKSSLKEGTGCGAFTVLSLSFDRFSCRWQEKRSKLHKIINLKHLDVE